MGSDGKVLVVEGALSSGSVTLCMGDRVDVELSLVADVAEMSGDCWYRQRPGMRVRVTMEEIDG